MFLGRELHHSLAVIGDCIVSGLRALKLVLDVYKAGMVVGIMKSDFTELFQSSNDLVKTL